MEFLKASSVFAAISMLYLGFAPNLLDIQPNFKNTLLIEKFEGGMAPNERLANAKKIYVGEKYNGPISMVWHKGILYTAVESGEIIAMSDDKFQRVIAKIDKTPNRINALRLHHNQKQLYFLDAYNGLYSVDIKTGKINEIWSSGTLVDGKKMMNLEDFTMDKAGNIYIAVASTKWNKMQLLMALFEHDQTSMILKLDMNGQITTLCKDLLFATGIQISPDQSSLIIGETLNNSVLIYHLKGSKQGRLEPLASLPGKPDNIRLSNRGHYWIPQFVDRNATSLDWLEKLLVRQYPRKLMARFLHLSGSLLELLNGIIGSDELAEFAHNVKWGIVYVTQSKLKHCSLIEMHQNGTILQSLQSSDVTRCGPSEALEFNDGTIYTASFYTNYLLKTKL